MDALKVRPFEPDVPDYAAILRIVKTVRGTVWEMPLLLAAALAARRSEVLPIRWADLDLTTGRVRIVRTLQRVPGGFQFMDTKTERSRRDLYLPGDALKVLKRYRLEQTERRLSLGEAWTDMDLICDRGDGMPLSGDSFSKAFKRIAATAGLPKSVRLHDIRHAVVIELGRRGNHPKKIADFAGHFDPGFTMRVYQRAWKDGMDDVAATLNDAFGEL